MEPLVPCIVPSSAPERSSCILLSKVVLRVNVIRPDVQESVGRRDRDAPGAEDRHRDLGSAAARADGRAEGRAGVAGGAARRGVFPRPEDLHRGAVGVGSLLRSASRPPDGGAREGFKVLTTPPIGGDMLWASTYEAYERLTPVFKKFVEGLTAIHSSKLQAEATIAQGRTLRRPVVEFEHPVVRTHPVTKRKALYVNSEFTTRINNLSAAESDAVLRFLTNHIAQGHEFQVRFHWTKNAVAIWDNRVTAHYATFDYLPGNRHAVRVTPHGEIPYFENPENNHP
ncbi:hypothetical protein ON010_g12445 [Phytophthora cinnamomi]|nr:hypothetical protein ON010_g12445 [Phytophthora cinnamomi]